MQTKEKKRQQVMDDLLRCIVDMPARRGARRGAFTEVSYQHNVCWIARVAVDGIRFRCEAADAAMLHFSVALRLSDRWRRMRAALARACEAMAATDETMVFGRLHTAIQLYEPASKVAGSLGARVWCGSGLVSSEFRAYGNSRPELAGRILEEFDRN